MGSPEILMVKPLRGILLSLLEAISIFSSQGKSPSGKSKKKEVITMSSKRNISICGILVCLFLFFTTLTPVNAADTTEQIINQIDEILKANPLQAGQKAQTIKIAEDNTVTLLVLRLVEGAEVKSHLHKTHDEIVCVIKGIGQTMVGDKWVDIKPGTIHFNPMGKVHATKNVGKEPLVAISIFTPAMKEIDRHFVQ
jgi:mannose-6-phosphate isomerase-like protein (cupin superfamily)